MTPSGQFKISTKLLFLLSLELKNQNTEYQMALEKMNQELDTLNSKKVMLEDEVAISALKREALTLYENLRDLQLRRDELVDEVS